MSMRYLFYNKKFRPPSEPGKNIYCYTKDNGRCIIFTLQFSSSTNNGYGIEEVNVIDKLTYNVTYPVPETSSFRDKAARARSNTNSTFPLI